MSVFTGWSWVVYEGRFWGCVWTQLWLVPWWTSDVSPQTTKWGKVLYPSPMILYPSPMGRHVYLLCCVDLTNHQHMFRKHLSPFVLIWLCIAELTGEGNGNPLQYSCLENPMDWGAWWAAVHGVARSWTRLSDFTFTFHLHALEKEMATHSSVLAWRIPGMVEPGGLPSMGSHRVGHDWSNLAAVATAMSVIIF